MTDSDRNLSQWAFPPPHNKHTTTINTPTTLHPTTRMFTARQVLLLLLLLLRHAQGTPAISGTKRATRDPRGSKRPYF